MVGSDPACDWRIAGANIARNHLELMWSEEILWVCAVGGQVWLDGSPVDSWTAVEWDTTIFLGDAEMRVFGAAAEDDPVISSVDELFAAAAAVEVAPPEADDITAQIVVRAPEPTPQPVAGRRAWSRARREPRVEDVGVIAPTETMQYGLSPTETTGELPEDTVFSNLDSLRRWADSCIEEPQPGVAPSPPAPVPLPTPDRLPVVESMAPVSTAPAPAQPIAVDGCLAAPPPSVDTKSAAEPADPFMWRVIDCGQRVYEAIPTGVVLGAIAAITIIVSLLVVDTITSKPQRRAHAADAPVVDPVVDKSGESAQLVRNTTPELEPGERALEEARAARLVAAGHLDEALPVYQQLAAADPDSDAYAIAANVLRLQLASRCQPGDKTCAR